jgi:hypothetical protein
MPDPASGKLEPRLIYNKQTTVLPNNAMRHQITVDASIGAAGIRKIVIRELARAQRDNPGIAALPDTEIDKIVEAAMQGVQTIEQPEVSYNIQVNMAVFRRGIFKIAYELAFMWLGESYLDDPIAAKLRAIILDGVDPETLGIHGAIELGCEINSLCFWAADKDCHVAFSAVVDGKVAIALKIFDVFSAVVEVSEQAAIYTGGLLEPDVTRFVHIDPVSGTRRESSLSNEIGRIGTQTATSTPIP